MNDALLMGRLLRHDVDIGRSGVQSQQIWSKCTSLFESFYISFRLIYRQTMGPKRLEHLGKFSRLCDCSFYTLVYL